MSYYIILFSDGSLRIYKNKHDQTDLPKGARQFESSSNITVQDLYVWANNGFKESGAIKEIEN
jgi:hypothetical protein